MVGMRIDPGEFRWWPFIVGVGDVIGRTSIVATPKATGGRGGAVRRSVEVPGEREVKTPGWRVLVLSKLEAEQRADG